MTNNFNKYPYFNDFDETKNFLEVLFKPDKNLQSRELLHIQSILKNQINVIGKHLFKEGTPVINGQLSIKKILYVVVENNYGGFPVVIEEFLNKNVQEQTSANVNTKYSGKVIKTVLDSGKKTLFIDTKNIMEVGNKVKIDGQSTYGTISEVGQCIMVAVNEGIFYLLNNFVYVPSQFIILENYNDKPTGVAGLTYEETVITSAEDSSLLDPARGFTNYGSSGADRLKIEATLTYFKDTDTLPDNFARLYEIKEGESASIVKNTIYSELARELARRTEDESGSYTVNPFTLSLEEGIKNKILEINTSGVIKTVLPHNVLVGDEIFLTAPSNSGNYIVSEVIDSNNFRIPQTFASILKNEGMTFIEEKTFSIIMGKGKAYVKGFEIEKISSNEISVQRARVKQLVENYNIVPTFGNYVIVDNVNGFLNASDVSTVTLYNNINGTGGNIGTASVVFFRHHSGIKGLTTTQYRMYLLNLNFISSNSFANVRSFKSGTFTANVTASSIVAGNATLNSLSNSALIYKIPQEGVATLEPGGTNNTSYVSHEFMSGPASGSTITMSLGAGTGKTFYGPSGVNFAGTDIEQSLYHFVNTTTQDVLNVTSIIISNNNRQLDVTFSVSGGSVSALLPVQFTNKSERTKTVASGSVVIPAGTLNNSNRKYSLNKADIISITSVMINGVNEKSKFSFDDGQRDSSYEYGSIILNNGAVVSQTHAITVNFTYFAHTGNGYFSVDSYPVEYKDIPTYNSKTSNLIYNLSDCIDFRPSPTNDGIPIPNVPISADYEFYLPRKDLVVMYADGQFGIVEGKPDVDCKYPPAPADGIILYKLEIPPYTKYGKDVQVLYVDNKRYTMKDIGVLDKRIGRLEYYTNLSFLEFDANNQTLYDENGFERFKNGFLVDSFTGHGVGDVYSGDYLCSVDPRERVARPYFTTKNMKLLKTTTSGVSLNSNSDKIGEVITLPYTSQTFIFNNVASRSESVNPYLVTDRIGELYTNPPSDDWVDTNTAPTVSVNLEGDQDNWETLTSVLGEQAIALGTQWGAWETTWTGDPQTSISRNFNGNTTTFTTTQNITQTQTGTQTNLGFETISQNIGNNVIDVNLAYFMRDITILVTAEGLRPNRDYHVFIDEENVNSLVSNQSTLKQSEGIVRSDTSGNLSFNLNIPAGRFRTGERTITVIDDIQNNIENATSYASYVFAASGLIQTVRDTVISVRAPVITTSTVTQTRNVTNVLSSRSITRPQRERGEGGQRDPLAQSFFVSPSLYPNGVFLNKVTVYIRNKPTENIPLQVQIRPMINGYPHSTEVLPFSNIYVSKDNVNIPVNTADMNSILNAGTIINFDAPVYLEPGKEYALIVLSSSPEYEAYISVLGQKAFGTNQIISSQISLGSLFKSQNASTWTASQYEDLMMKLEICNFSLNPGIVNLNGNFASKFYINEFKHNIEVLNFSNVTNIKSEYRTKESNTLVLNPYKEYNLNENVELATEQIVNAANDFMSKLTLTTTDKYVSPIVDLSRNSVTCVHNEINNFGLVKSGFNITSGTGYTTATATVVGGGGFGAVLTPVLSGGKIVNITITNPGEGYTSNPTITVSGNGTGGSIVYEGVETDTHGGNALSRYITRKINLAEGMDADYLTVQFDVNKRFGTGVKVYYKFLSSEDNDIIENKNWIEMKKQSENNPISTSPNDYFETTYVPVGDTITYTSNGYTYTSGNVIAVKVVFLSNNTSIVPKIKNFRVLTSL